MRLEFKCHCDFAASGHPRHVNKMFADHKCPTPSDEHGSGASDSEIAFGFQPNPPEYEIHGTIEPDFEED